jgi:hypothetical protein
MPLSVIVNTMVFALTRAASSTSGRAKSKSISQFLRHDADIRTVQEVLGRDDVSTTMIYTHVLQQGGNGIKNPLDSL